jgi:diguanylate cyclase (GGDEF)-like protein
MGSEIVVLARFLLTGIALLLAFLATVAWNRRKEVPEAAAFGVLVLSMAVYAFGYAGEVVQTTLAGAVWWLHVEYLALPWAGGLWVLAASRHNGLKVRPALLFIVPLITFVGHYTNYDNLFYNGPMILVHRAPFWVLEVQRGPLSTLDNAYLLVCFVAGSWIYLSGLRHAAPLHRKQAIILVLSSLVPFLGYFTYLGNLSPWELDITPITLGITCLLLYFGIFRYGIFDLAPLARNLIFNSIRDAVLILDTQDRLLDFNPAAAKLLPELRNMKIGSEVVELLAATPGLASALGQAEGMKVEGVHADLYSNISLGLDSLNTDSLSTDSLGAESNHKSYEVQYWPLFADKRQLGRAMIFADVTAQVRLREDLRRRAETDPLTGVANRRLFQKTLEMECFRYGRSNLPMSVMMIDLDYFKAVNDRYGHPVGDAVLRVVAQRLLGSVRKTDLLARFGGEEFSVLLPDTRVEGARVIAERVRQAVNQSPIEVDGVLIPMSVSVGIASHSTELEAVPDILLKKADLALYRAKAAGRNRVEAS